MPTLSEADLFVDQEEPYSLDIFIHLHHSEGVYLNVNRYTFWPTDQSLRFEWRFCLSLPKAQCVGIFAVSRAFLCVFVLHIDRLVLHFWASEWENGRRKCGSEISPFGDRKPISLFSGFCSRIWIWRDSCRLLLFVPRWRSIPVTLKQLSLFCFVF